MMNAAPKLPRGSDSRISNLLDQGLAQYSRRQKRRKRTVGIAAGAAVLLAGGSLAWVTLAPHVQQVRSAYCYSAASTDSRYTQVGLPDEVSSSDGTSQIATPSDRAASAVDLCASAWTAGILSDDTEVPTLVVCVRPDNVLAVFPKTASDARTDQKLCSDLDLALER